MSMRESFLKMLAGETPDLVVWTADISYWMAGERQAGRANPTWDTERGYLELHKSLGVMPYYYYDKFWAGTVVADQTVTTERAQSANVTVTTTTTPVGTLTAEHVFLPESCCEGITKHPVQTESDLDVLLHILEHSTPRQCNLDDYNDRSAMWEEFDGVPCLGLPRSPLPSLCYEWTGVQNLVFLMMDHEDKVRNILGIMEAHQESIVDAVCELAPPLVHFPDNLSSDNLTGYYDEYMDMPYRRRLEKLHNAGVKSAVHLDGAVKGLLPKLIESGIDAVEALTPKPTGDMDVEEMAAIAGDSKAILWGGVPGAMFAPTYSWEQMASHIDQLLESWGGRPFVMGVADQVPPDGDIEFCRKIADKVR